MDEKQILDKALIVLTIFISIFARIRCSQGLPAAPEIICSQDGIYGVAYPITVISGQQVTYSIQRCVQDGCTKKLWKNQCVFHEQQKEPMMCHLVKMNTTDVVKLVDFYSQLTYSTRLLVQVVSGSVEEVHISAPKTFSLITCPKFELEQPKVKEEGLNRGFNISVAIPKGWIYVMIYKSLALNVTYYKRDKMLSSQNKKVYLDYFMESTTVKIVGLSVFTEYIVQLDVTSLSDPESIVFQKMNFVVRTRDAAPAYIPDVKMKSVQEGDLFRVLLKWNMPNNRSLNGYFRSYEVQLKELNTSWKMKPAIINDMNMTVHRFNGLQPGVKYEARVRALNQHHAGNYSYVQFGPYALENSSPLVWNPNPVVVSFAVFLFILVVLALVFVVDGHRKEKKKMQSSTTEIFPDEGTQYQIVQENNAYFMV